MILINTLYIIIGMISGVSISRIFRGRLRKKRYKELVQKRIRRSG